MKKLLKNKKFWICTLIVLVLAILIIGCITLFNKEDPKKEIRDEIIKSYVAYVKINPVIKLEFSQTCRNTDEGKSVNTDCNDPIVTKYELINEDAKTIYKDVNLIDVTDQLWSVLNLINETAKEHKIDFDTVEIYSNWTKLDNYIENKKDTTYKWSYNINIVTKDELNDVANSFENEKIIHTVTFDTDGGNIIESQEVEDGNKIIKPNNPTKEGFEFVEWQLDNKKFNFNKNITEDITLTAKWEKIKTENIDSDNTNDSNTNETSNNTNSNNSSTENNNTQTEETVYFDIPWEIINNGTYEQFAKEHGITINLVADSKYKCNSHFSEPDNPKGYKKGDVVIAYGFMGQVCIENCDGCTGEEECATNPPKFETKFQFGACGVG